MEFLRWPDNHHFDVGLMTGRRACGAVHSRLSVHPLPVEEIEFTEACIRTDHYRSTTANP